MFISIQIETHMQNYGSAFLLKRVLVKQVLVGMLFYATYFFRYFGTVRSLVEHLSVVVGSCT